VNRQGIVAVRRPASIEPLPADAKTPGTVPILRQTLPEQKPARSKMELSPSPRRFRIGSEPPLVRSPPTAQRLIICCAATE
jgi:hypothetical protein